MRVFVAFVAYLLGSLLLSALLLPVLYPGVQALLGDEAEPSRVLYRLAMLFMLLGFPWFLKRLDLLGWRALGFILPARATWLAVFRGLGIGFLILLVLSVGLVLVGARVYAPDDDAWTELLYVVVTGLVGGLLVGLIEETFFRGMMHTGLRRSLSFPATAFLTGMFYAAVHFIRPDRLQVGAEVDVITSLSMLLGGLAGLTEIGRILDSFAALLVAGVFLSMVRERTGHIGWVIGIHAGWVLAIRLIRFLTDSDRSEGLSIWVGYYDKVTGLMAAILLAAVAAFYWQRSAHLRGADAHAVSASHNPNSAPAANEPASANDR